MDLIQAIMGRRSIRSFSNSRVPIDMIEQLVRCATAAPNPHNSRPWHFIVIDDEGVKGRLASSLVNSYRESGQGDKTILESARLKTTAPPLTIIGCVDKMMLKKDNDLEYMMATQGLAAAAENILVAATALGLCGYWRAAPLTCMPAVRKALAIPEYVDPQWMLHIGFAGEASKKARVNEPGENVIHYNCW